MATLLHSESRRLYSWWWDSHISPKNSKWLQENLTDMDAKVKAMIKLIEEDADSFARRAEMYYKKRPELMKLVEEFYRAYRALAERYNHATGELCQAHRTMAEAFPNQVPFVLTDDTPSSSEPHTPIMPLPIRSFFDVDDSSKDGSGLSSSNFRRIKRTGACAEESDSGAKRKGLKQLNEMFHAGDAVPQDAKSTEVKGEGKEYILAEDLAQLSDENQNLKARILSESERAGKAETELQILKEALAKVEAERDAVLFQHQQILEKLTNLEKELSLAQKDARDLDQQASKAETEVKVLKESLVKLEAERDANLLKYRESLDRVAVLETMITAAREDARGMSDQAAKAETESHNLKQELRRSEGEKEAGRLLYEQCLEKISVLENQVSLAEENAKILDKQSCRAQSEVKALKEQLLKLNEEKEDIGIQYNQCLEMISKLQNELREAQEDARWLNNEILLGSAKLKGTEEKCALLGKMNQSLQLEADDLAQQISTKDQELSEKQAELEKLQSSLQDERCRFVQVEATLHTLQNLHSQSQEEQRALASELRVGLQMLKDLKLSKQNLEAEIKQLMEENRSLNDLNLASSISEKNLQGQLSHLREIKEKLEGEVRRQAEQTDSLQQEVHLLKEEMEELYKRYQALMKQVEYVGLDPECLGSSVKSLQEENSRLKKSSCMDRAEKELLCKKLEHMDDLLKKSCVFESSLTDVSAELERSKEKARTLQDSCLVLNGEKSTLITEKAALLSQLQILAESMQKILEKNASLENSLSSANSELEGLRAKSKSLEEFCQLLNSERSNLLAEKSALMFRLENVEQKLEILETRFTKLEDNYACLEKENQSTLSQVEELRVSLGVEKQERACLVLTSEARVSSLEDRIYHLQEENKCRKNEFEEQLDKAANAQFEIFILKKFIEDMEEKNYSLLFECQKHVEAGKYSEKLIAELEGENMMQQVETEFLLDKISKLRMGIYQVLKALEINHVGEAESDLNVMPCILANIKDIRSSLSESKDENQQLVIGNSILTTVVKQLYLEVKELASRKEVLDQEFLILTRQHSMLENEKRELSQRNCCLDVKLSQREKAEEALKAEIEGLHEKLVGIEVLHAALQEENLKALKEKHFLQVELSDLLVAKCKLEQDNDTVFLEALAVSIQDVIFQSYGIEKALELDRLYKDLDCLRKAYSDLEEEAIELRTWLEMKDVENLNVRESIKILEEKQHELNGYHDQFKCEMLLRQELLDQKESELLEAEQELKATQDLNTGLRQTVELVEKECEDLKVARENLEDEILELSKYNRSQDEEIGRLQEANERLESQTGSLQEKIEEYKIREAILSSELHERSGEFELWEAEAASFYFDLQISGIREVLFENKVQELGGLCEDLEVVSSRRSVEIGMMKEKVSLLESEVEGLKNQLAAYVPVIASLKDDIESLEQDPFLQTKLHLANSTDKQVTVESNISEPRDLNSLEPDGLSQLQKLQSKVKVIQKLLIEVRERVAMQERKKADIKLEATMKEIEELRSRINALRQKNIHEEEGRYGDPRRVNGILMESGPEASEARNRTRMKDIPLDQVSDSSSSGNSKRRNGHPDDEMLQLWETAERASSRDLVVSKTLEQALMPKEDEVLYHEFVIGEQNSLNPTIESQIEKELGVDKLELSKNCNNSNHEGNKLNILERLACDAQKLMDLQISVQELRMKMETNKRKRSTKDVEYDRLRDQLRDVENSVMQLVDMNTELMKTVEDRPSTSNAVSSMELDEGDHVLRKRVAEQVRRGSEKIARLQLELQKIQYMWQKMEDEKKRKGKGRFSRSHAGFVLRDFVYSHGRSRRQKKGRFCGCLRPTPEEN